MLFKELLLQQCYAYFHPEINHAESGVTLH